MMNYIILGFKFLGRHIFKIVFVPLAIIGFLLVLFPLKDLSDLISTQVLNATGNAVYVQFKDVSFNPATMTIELEDVELDTPVAQELKSRTLSFSPGIFDLIGKKPSGVVTAEGLFGDGVTRLQLKSHNAYTDKIMSGTATLTVDNGSLNEIHKVLQTAVPLSGQLFVDANITVEVENLAEAEAPAAFVLKSIQDGDVSIKIKKFKMPQTMIMLPQGGGAFQLPLIEFNDIDLKAKIQSGKITIESSKIGSPSDELFGTIRGELALLNPIPAGMPLTAIVQEWNITMELTAKQSFKDRAETALVFFTEIEKDPSGLSRYRVNLKSPTQNLIGPSTR